MTILRSLKKIFFSYRSRVVISVTLLVFFVLFLSNALTNQFVVRSQIDNIRSRLTLIAQTAALMIDADALQKIPLDPSGVSTEEFRAVSETLNKIKKLDPQIRYIYTMTQSDQPGTVRFIVDADTPAKTRTTARNLSGAEDELPLSFPGDPYDASEMPDLLRAFETASADHELTRDQWGTFLSGYAPIRDKNHHTIAILGVDFSADDIAATIQNYRERVTIAFEICLIVGLFLGLFMARSITRPVNRLAHGIRRVAKGDLQYRMTENREDEIGELIHAFNGMSKKLYRSRRQLLSYFSSVVRSLIRVLEARNPYTKGHSENVAHYAGRIALKMGFSREDVKLFKKIALLHDIGKVGVCDNILNKEGSLTQEEYSELKKHPVIGEGIVKPIMKNTRWLSIIRGHHERVDGTGYPDQLQGKDINIFAAIVAVADSYDAMTSDRSYRKALSHEQARAELVKHRGAQFHPDVVDAFLSVLDSDLKKPRPS